MRHQVIAWAAAALIGSGLSQHAQDRTPMQQAQAATVEGCLEKGTRAGEFNLIAADQRYLVVPAEGVDLMAHIDHRVQLTGTVERGSTGSVLRASGLKMIAPTCRA
jgi:hypothetical protein